MPTTTHSEVAVRKFNKRDASQHLDEIKQRPKRAATRDVRYSSSGPKVAAESTSREAKVSFAVMSRLTAVEDRAASLRNDNESLKTQIQDLETRVTSLTEELERLQKETTSEIKGLIDDTIYGYLFQNKLVTITKHVTKQFHVGAPEI